MEGIQEYGCGQCKTCKINRSRVWIIRMLLEAKEHPYSAFVTLTYSDECLPKGGSLLKRDAQHFMKRLRKELSLEGREVRYFMSAEYGERGGRPHYHYILFGVSPLELDLLKKVWYKGLVHSGEVNQKTIQYIAGYMLKSFPLYEHQPKSYQQKEFQLQSRKPGLGFGLVEKIKSSFKTKPGKSYLSKHGPKIVNTIHTNGRHWPIGRYLRNSVYQELGLQPDDVESVNAIQQKKQSELRRSMTTEKYLQIRNSKLTAQIGRYKKQERTL